MRFPVLMSLLVLAATLDGAAAAELDSRPDLSHLKSRTVDVQSGFLIPVLDSLVPPLRREVADIRTGMGLELSSKTRQQVWVSVRLLSPPAGAPDERFASVVPARATHIACALDTVYADVDYLFDIWVFTDSTRTDTLESIQTRVRFERSVVRSHIARLARTRRALPATKLPQSYADMLQDVGGSHRKGRMTVWPDRFEFVSAAGEQIVSASEVGAVYLSDNWIKVHFWQGGLWRQLAFGHRPGKGQPLALKLLMGDAEELPIESEQRDMVLTSLQAMVAQRDPALAPGPEGKQTWFKRLRNSGLLGSEPPPPVALQEPVSLEYAAPTRRGQSFEIGIGYARSSFPSDTFQVLTGGGLGMSLAWSGYLNPNLTLGLRASMNVSEVFQQVPIPSAVWLFLGPAAQYWVTDRWFLSGGAGYAAVTAVDGPDADGFGLSGRVGYAVPGGRRLHTGVTLEVLPGFYPGATATAVVLALNVQASGKQ